MSHRTLTRLTMAAALSCVAAAHATAGTKTIDLQFTPTENVTAPIPATRQGLFGRKIRLLPVVDKRETTDPFMIGRRGGGDPVRSGDAVSEFVSHATEQCLTEWGLALDDSGDYVLAGELVKFNIDVQTLFSASVHLRFHLTRADGESLWQGLVMGDARRFGLSAKKGNYNETLSDALKEALAQLLADDGFQNGLIGRVPTAEPVNLLITPDELLKELLSLVKEGFGEEMLLAYVGQRTLQSPLMAVEIVQWKQEGLPDKVIQEAMNRVRQP